MVINRRIWNTLLATSITVTLFGCVNTTKKSDEFKEADEIRQAPVRSETNTYLEVTESKLGETSADQYKEIFKKYAHLEETLMMMGESNIDTKLNAAIAGLRKKPNIASDVFGLYMALTDASRRTYYAFSEARWRSVYLLGELRLQEANASLFKIASEPLPNPEKVQDTIYATEYRILSRAIAGLENNKAVDELRTLYERGGPISGVVAASLYELGAPPKGTKLLDPAKTLGRADPTDFKPKKETFDASRMQVPPAPKIEESQSITLEPKERK